MMNYAVVTPTLHHIARYFTTETLCVPVDREICQKKFVKNFLIKNLLAI